MSPGRCLSNSRGIMFMEATYYNDTLHSYMIIPCPPEAETTGYQYRMLEMNRIEGILPCGIRHIDGAGFLYYETTGRQSLTALYEGRKIPGSELFKLLKTLDRVSGTLSEYLLDEQHLVLTEDQIFYDISSGKYCFTYYPGEVVSPGVFRFLAQSIDGKEKQAAAAAYRLYAAAEDSRQVLRQAVKEEAAQKDLPRPWEKVLEDQPERNGIYGKNGPVYEIDERYSGKTASEPGGRQDGGKLPDEEEAAVPGRRDSNLQKEREGDAPSPQNGKKQLVIRILLIIILLAGAGGLIAVQLLVYISQRERRLCIAGSILLLISAFLIIAEMVLRHRELKRKRREEEAYRKPSYSESDEKDLPVFGTGGAEDYRLSGDEAGNTVRFSEQETIGRLYGRDRGSRIDLRTLPVTVGKAQAYVDTVLPDPSVSRVHARIYKGEEGGILIRDLNSTNGTFINGTRLEPNEKKRVQRGDEVRFGNMEFEYR